MVVGFLMIIGKCCVEGELSGRIDFFSLLCRGSSSRILAYLMMINSTPPTSVSSKRARRPSKLTQNERNKEPFYCRKIFYRR